MIPVPIPPKTIENKSRNKLFERYINKYPNSNDIVPIKFVKCKPNSL